MLDRISKLIMFFIAGEVQEEQVVMTMEAFVITANNFLMNPQDPEINKKMAQYALAAAVCHYKKKNFYEAQFLCEEILKKDIANWRAAKLIRLIQKAKKAEENQSKTDIPHEGDALDKDEEKSDSADNAGVPAGEQYRYLYNVQGIYKYTAMNSAELSFDVGDIIDVIAYDDPEKQVEGYLMGVFNGVKGLFPANFTFRI